MNLQNCHASESWHPVSFNKRRWFPAFAGMTNYTERITVSEPNEHIMKNLTRSRVPAGQSLVEFIAALGVFIMVVFAVTQVLSWSGKTMIKVQKDHESELIKYGNWESPDIRETPMGQVDKFFFTPPKMELSTEVP